MPDLAMCTNSSCNKHSNCYRYMAIPDSWQSYMEFKNICGEQNEFRWFYPIDGRDIRSEELKENNE